MSYFSGLIQQTGIAFGVQTPGFPELESADEHRSREAVVPLEVETVQVDSPESLGKMERSDRLVRSDRPQSVTDHPPISPDASSQTFFPPRSPDIAQPSFPPHQTIEPMMSEVAAIQAAVEPNTPILESELREISLNSINEIQQKRSPASSLDSIEQDRQVGRSAQSITSPEQPTPQAYMQMVREWVTQAPIAIERSPIEDSQIDTSPIEQVREMGLEQFASLPPPAIHEGLGTSQRAVNAVQSPIAAARYADPPDIQEFVLSIGSIQLTVETPQPLLQTPVAQPPSPQPARSPQPEGARLSRHYLRV